jgi:hypothetical protein
MDTFEKQQTVEAIKVVIKARWFYAISILLQGIVMRIIVKDFPLANNYLLILITLGVVIVNLLYWIYLRRAAEKINSFVLKSIKAMQIILDQLAIFGVFYFSGTVNKLLVVSLFITLMVGSYLYGKKGIILSVILASSIYSGLAIMEYFGFLSTYYTVSPLVQPSLNGDINLLKGFLISFNSYLLSAVFFAVFLSSLFKTREKRLQAKTDEAVRKSELLFFQTQQLTQAQGELQGALTRSDVARRAATQARDETEKANLELKQKIDELEKFYKVTVGREVRIAELKSEIKELKKKVKE